MTTIERLRVKVQQHQQAQELTRARRWAKIGELWEKCCEAEGIDPEVGINAFRRDNPYLQAFNGEIAAYIVPTVRR